MNISNEHLTSLAMEYDPAPILQFLTQAEAQQAQLPQSFATGESYADLLQPQQGGATPPPSSAPLDPNMLRMLGGMSLADGRPPSAGIPGRPGPVQLQQAPVVQPKTPVQMSLGQILGGR